MDDPGIFSAFVPWWIFPLNKLRWSICTEDVFFANKYVQKIMAGGNGLPLDRSGLILIYQKKITILICIVILKSIIS